LILITKEISASLAEIEDIEMIASLRQNIITTLSAAKMSARNPTDPVTKKAYDDSVPIVLKSIRSVVEYAVFEI
jgi:hypothetical protein